MNALEARTRDFASAVLARCGALVEWSGDQEQGMAMLPQEIGTLLGVQEAVSICLAPSLRETGDTRAAGTLLSVGITSEFPDQAQLLLQNEPRITRLKLPQAYLKQSGIEEAVGRQFGWLNARVRIQEVAAGRCEYHQWYITACVESEERWEELIAVSINKDTGASVSLPNMLEHGDLVLANSSVPADLRSLSHAAIHAARIAQHRGAQFITRLEARLDRDRKRLQSYYRALLLESKNPRARAAADPQQREDRKRAVDLELRRKLQELEERYVLRTRLTPQALATVDMPVLIVRCEVTRRQAKALHNIYWNPLTRSLEPIRCHQCGTNAFALAFTDDQVLPLCPECETRRK